jgi:hypothetical protein
MEIYLPMQLTDWLLVEVGLLLIGVTKISFQKFLVLTTRLYELESSLRCGPCQCWSKNKKFKKPYKLSSVERNGKTKLGLPFL